MPLIIEPLPKFVRAMQVVLPGSFSSQLMDLDAYKNGALLFELRLPQTTSDTRRCGLNNNQWKGPVESRVMNLSWGVDNQMGL